MKRLGSIDVLRGLDMFCIVGGTALIAALAAFVPDSEPIARQMQHVEWEGLRFYDCIFPVFVFISGLTFPFSHARQVEKDLSRTASMWKILKRMSLLVFIGMVYNGFLGADWRTLGEFRYASVLAKIGIGWGLAALIWLYTGRRGRLIWLVAGLVGYWVMLMFTALDAPADASNWSLEGCFPGYLDRLATPGHLYCDGLLEPSGPFVSFFAYPSALLGMFAGDYVRTTRTPGPRTAGVLALAGLVVVTVGVASIPVCPVIKKLWTPSFTLITAGAGCLAFAFFHWLVDIRGWRGCVFFFTVIGENALGIYILQRFIDFPSLAQRLFGGPAGLCGTWKPVALAFAVIAIKWGLLYFCHRRSLFFKV